MKIYEEDNRYNNYDALYFGKYVEPDVLKKYKYSERYREFNDRKKFVEVLKSGGFKIHQRRREDIIVKIEKYYFKFFFDLSKHQRIILPMRELAEIFDFKVKYAGSNDFYGRYEFESHVWGNYYIQQI